VNKLTTFLENE